MALEEADKILLSSLKDIGFDCEEATSLADLSAGQVYEAVAMCLHHIQPELRSTLSVKFPASLTSRLNMCTLMVNQCKELGYRPDLGYQTILYGTAKEIRNIISFLVDKFPRQEIVIADPHADPRTLVLRGMQAALSEALSAPASLQSGAAGRRVPFRSQPLSSWSGTFVTLQPRSSSEVLPSIIDWSARLAVSGRARAPPAGGLASSLSATARGELAAAQRLYRTLRQQLPVPAPRRSQTTTETRSETGVSDGDAPTTAPADTPAAAADGQRSCPAAEQLLQQRQLATLTAQLERTQRKLAKGADRCRRLQLLCGELESSSAAASPRLPTRRAALLARRRAREALLAGADAASGGTAVSRAQQRADARRAEWRRTRDQLEREVEELKRRAPLLDVRRRERELGAELQTRQRALHSLRQQAAAQTKYVKRSAYTKRILEIVGSVKKQREGIAATIQETRQLRKDINTTEDKIARSFQAAEELIFQDASGSEWSRASYRGLVSLHESCSQLVEMVEQTAAVMRRARRVEEEIEVERSRDVEANLAQLRADLENVRLENRQLRGEASGGASENHQFRRETPRAVATKPRRRDTAGVSEPVNVVGPL